MTDDELFENAISIENRAHLGKGHLEIEFFKTIARGTRLYDFYKDTEGRYWYSVRIQTKDGPASEYEAIFGRKRI